MASKIGPFVSCLTVMVTTWGSPMRASICEDMRRSSVKTTKQLWIAGWFFGILQGSPNFRCGKVFEEFFSQQKKSRFETVQHLFGNESRASKPTKKENYGKSSKPYFTIYHHWYPILIPYITIFTCVFLAYHHFSTPGPSRLAAFPSIQHTLLIW